MTEKWRLITDAKPQCGAWNMAIDEAIMREVGKGNSLPTLRFYAWQPACLSLGYGQSYHDADLERLQEYGWDLVRRPTGGKAILHTDELTYSIAFPDNHPLTDGGILPSYRRLSKALLTGLQQLGVEVESYKKHLKDASGPVCFEVPSDYEITVHGKKLVGSAQVRRANAVLQHGSIPLKGDIARICDGLAFEDEANRASAKIRVHDRATTIEAALGKTLNWQTISQSLTQAFMDTFNIELIDETLTELEQVQSQHFYETIYNHVGWNQRR